MPQGVRTNLLDQYEQEHEEAVEDALVDKGPEQGGSKTGFAVFTAGSGEFLVPLSEES